MKKYFFIVFLLFFGERVLSQKIYVEYMLGDEYGSGFLAVTDTISYWQEFYDNTGMQTDGTIVISSSDTKFYVVKKFKENLIYHSSKNFGKIFYIMDSLHTMQWSLGKERKEILGYKCKSATTTFRGRKYIAYYTSKIPISNGPWKFGGLPGLILEIKSYDDKSFNFLAQKISKNEIQKLDNFPLDPKNFISWQVFVQKYEEAAKAYIDRIKAGLKPGETSQVLILTKEIIYAPINSGKGIRIE